MPALRGNGLLSLAAFCRAVSIAQIRRHTWISTPCQLAFWEVLIAALLLALLAAGFDGVPQIPWNTRFVLLFLHAGVAGVALAY